MAASALELKKPWRRRSSLTLKPQLKRKNQNNNRKGSKEERSFIHPYIPPLLGIIHY
jgi:hypothetical protein